MANHEHARLRSVEHGNGSLPAFISCRSRSRLASRSCDSRQRLRTLCDDERVTAGETLSCPASSRYTEVKNLSEGAAGSATFCQPAVGLAARQVRTFIDWRSHNVTRQDTNTTIMSYNPSSPRSQPHGDGMLSVLLQRRTCGARHSLRSSSVATVFKRHRMSSFLQS